MAQISTRTAISSDRVTPFTSLLAYGEEFSGGMLIDTRHDQLNRASQIAAYCRSSRSEDMMLQINLAIAGQRDSEAEDLVIQAFGGYLGEGIEIEVAECP